MGRLVATLKSPLRKGSIDFTRPRFDRLASIVCVSAPYVLNAFAVIYLFSILTRGHLFSADYAVYLQQAWNIGHGEALGNMGVISWDDPARPLNLNGPITYPLGVPLLLSLPVLIFGYNLYVIKIVQLGILMVALFIFPLFMRRWHLSTLEICASIVSFCFSYELPWSVNTIGSDVPFILFLLFALYVINLVVQNDRPGTGLLLLAGLVIFLCMMVRTVAVILPVTLALSDLVARKRLRLTVICIPAITVGLLVGLQYLLGLSGESYSLVTKYRFFTPVENIYQFYWALTAPLAEARVPKWVIALFVSLAILAAAAVVYEAYKGNVLAIFLLSYTAMLLVLPNFNSGSRYLLPHILVFGAFATRGAVILAKIAYNRWSRLAPVGVAGGIVVVSMFVPSPLPLDPWNFGATSSSARELFSFIRGSTPLHAVVAGAKHRGLHLFTGRTTIRLPMRPDYLADWLRTYNVTYVVIKHSEPKVKYDFTDCPNSPFCEGDIASLGVIQVFNNSDFAVFAVSTSHEATGAKK